MLEKYDFISEIYKEPLEHIKKIVYNKNIMCYDGVIQERIPIAGTKQYIVQKLSRHGLSIEKTDYKFIPNHVGTDYIFASKKKFIDNVAKAKKANLFSNDAILKRLTVKILKKSFPDNEIIIDKAGVIIHYPELIITNSKGMQHTLRDIYVNYAIEGNKVKAYITRTTYTGVEVVYGYMHGHYSGIPNTWASLDRFCLGTNPLRSILENGATTATELRLLVKGVYELLIWESLEGGPYKTLSELFLKMVEFKGTAPVVYDSDALYLELLHYLKDKPGCIIINEDCKIIVNYSYVENFCRESNNDNLYGYFTDDNLEIAEPVLKDYSSYETDNLKELKIGDNLVQVRVIKHETLNNLTIPKTINELICEELENKLNIKLNESVELTWSHF